jgi:adenylate cyclase
LNWLTGRSKREARLRRVSLLALGAGTIFLLWVVIVNPLQTITNMAMDSLFLEREGSDVVVIVAIDDDALSRHGRLSEWPRTLHATAIDALRESQARVIVYDILFVDAGEGTATLARSVSEAGNVILPVAGAVQIASSAQRLPLYEDVLLPEPSLQDAAAALAHVNVSGDRDGRIRHVPLAISTTGGTMYPAISFAAMYMQFGHAPPGDLQPTSHGLSVFGRTVPLEDSSLMRINYAGTKGSFQYISFNDLVEGRVDPSSLRNKIVLVGLTAGAGDVHPAPIGRLNGVEIQANALNTLLHAQFLQPVRAGTEIMVAFMLVTALAVIVSRWPTVYAAGALLVLAGGWVSAALFLYLIDGRMLDPFVPPAALLVTAFAGLAYRTSAERAAHREVAALFGRYVADDVARELIARDDRGQLALGGELREVTTMFCDIRGFVTLSQTTPPEEMVGLLNRHFDVIVAQVLKHGGIVHQFVGDEVMAFWNAPNEQPDHALLACRAAIDAQAELALLESSDRVRFGFGINTGVVLAGNVGTAGRQQYTIIGQAVNTAARLCGLAGGGELWIGEPTYELIKETMRAEELPPQSLKGMDAPVKVYRLVK